VTSQPTISIERPAAAALAAARAATGVHPIGDRDGSLALAPASTKKVPPKLPAFDP